MPLEGLDGQWEAAGLGEEGEEVQVGVYRPQGGGANAGREAEVESVVHPHLKIELPAGVGEAPDAEDLLIVLQTIEAMQELVIRAWSD